MEQRKIFGALNWKTKIERSVWKFHISLFWHLDFSPKLSTFDFFSHSTFNFFTEWRLFDRFLDSEKQTYQQGIRFEFHFFFVLLPYSRSLGTLFFSRFNFLTLWAINYSSLSNWSHCETRCKERETQTFHFCESSLRLSKTFRSNF